VDDDDDDNDSNMPTHHTKKLLQVIKKMGKSRGDITEYPSALSM
jgi:hypothetical protein